MEIRRADVRDESLLSQLISVSHKDVAQRFHLTADNCPKHPSNCSRDWIEKDFERGVAYYILDHAGKPIACTALEHANPRACYLERLSVLPKYRRNGFGKGLVDHAMDVAREWGAEEIGIGIIAEFTELRDWYRKLGFVEGEVLDFKHLPFRVLLMTYGLT